MISNFKQAGIDNTSSHMLVDVNSVFSGESDLFFAWHGLTIDRLPGLRLSDVT